MPNAKKYRGRIAPTPTGLLHLGHARTFSLAAERCRQASGTLVMRIEDLDTQRCKKHFVDAAMEDLKALGIYWDEGPDIGGPCEPYVQSENAAYFLEIWKRLKDAGAIYPCRCSRKDVAAAARAPHPEDENAEPIFPPEWRPDNPDYGKDFCEPGDYNWRFRVPDGETITFTDALCGEQKFIAGKDFGDFVVWRRDGVPAYELAVVADDIRMGITEVVRGEDLLKSTARQILIYRALGRTPPAWAHAPLVLDENGKRLAKRHDALSVRALLANGNNPSCNDKKAGV